MTEVATARDAYLAARAEAAAKRLELGRAIQAARAQDVPQERIARELKLTREQIRRYEREHEKSLEPATA